MRDFLGDMLFMLGVLGQFVLALLFLLPTVVVVALILGAKDFCRLVRSLRR